MDKSDDAIVLRHTEQTDNGDLNRQDYILQQDMMGTQNQFQHFNSFEFNSPNYNLDSQLDSQVRYSNVYNQTNKDD